jgi:hypothetical protein
LVAIGLALLLSAWVVATRPFSGPDEASHYLRAFNIAQGHLLGPKIRYPALPGITPLQLVYVQHDTRAATVPAKLSPPDVNCIDGRPNLAGRCIEATSTGDYYPPAYVLPALAIKLSSTANAALWISRFLSALLCLAFILLAVALLYDGAPSSLLGLFVAVTPMVLFVSSILNPSGLEICASLATAAACLRIARRPDVVPRWVWVALALSSVVTLLAFQAGPGFVIADLALGAGFLGLSGLRELRHSQSRPLAVYALIALAALIVWFVYARVSGASHGDIHFRPVIPGLQAGWDQLGPVLRDTIGNFGSLTLPLPPAARAIWWVLVVTLIGSALWLGRLRERVLMGVVVLVGLGFPVLSYAWLYRYSGFGMQGRQVLPVLMLIPLAAGEIVHRRIADRAAHGLQIAVLAGIAAVILFQAYAWGYDASVTAGGPGTPAFYSQTTFAPPLGWAPWIAVVALGICALLGFAAVEALRGSRPRMAPSG